MRRRWAEVEDQKKGTRIIELAEAYKRQTDKETPPSTVRLRCLAIVLAGVYLSTATGPGETQKQNHTK